MIMLRATLVLTTLVCIITICVTHRINGVALIAILCVAGIALTTRPRSPRHQAPHDSSCRCPVDHSEALLDDERPAS